MISLGIWLAILLICFGAGAAALRRLRADTESWAEEVPFAAALGLGILAYLVLAVGMLGYLRAWVSIALIALLAILGLRHIARLCGQVSAAVTTVANFRWSALPLFLFFLIAVILTLIGALAPSGDLDYDGLVYHLTIPKLYIAHGGIYPIPWLSHSNFPFTLEMLYLLGLLLRDQSLAKLFHFGCGWLTACAIFALARRWWNARAAWLGAAMFAAIPLVGWQMMSAYNELSFALYAFLAVYALARWLEGQRERKGRGGGWLSVAAIMCGLAMGVKMLAAAVFLFAAGAMIWAIARGAIPPRAVTRIFAFAAVALAVAAPWYVKSYRWTGNPVYPFFYHIFDGRYWTQERADAYTDAQREFGLARGPLGFAALPWNLTMKPRWFFDHPQSLRSFNIFITVFGPLLLAFVPTLLVTGPVGGPGRLLLSFAVVYAAVWFALTQNGRYLMPILPGLCACAGLAAARLLERRGVVAPPAVVALLLGLLSGLYPSFALAAPAARVAIGAESRAAYLTRTWPPYPMFEAIEKLTPADARILVLGDEPRFFYLNRDYLFGNHAEIFTEQDLASPDAFLNALRRMDVTHLLFPASALGSRGASSGRIEAQIAGLAAAGRIEPLLRDRRYPLVLWGIGDERDESPG